MGDRNVLVVYYSRTGTTAKVAKAIAEALQCDAEEIVDTKNRRGVIGWLGAAKGAALGKTTAIAQIKNDPGGYDLVAVGTPVWAGSVPPAIRAYLSQCKDRLPDVAFFLTTGGSGIARTFRRMERLCEKAPLATLGLRQKDVKKDDHLDAVKEFVETLQG